MAKEGKQGNIVSRDLSNVVEQPRPRYRAFHSLRGRILAIALPPILLGVLVSFVFFEVMVHRNLLRDLDEKIAQSAELEGNILAGPVWYLDIPDIQDGLKTMVGDADIVAALVGGRRGSLLAWCQEVRGLADEDPGDEPSVICGEGETLPESLSFESYSTVFQDIVFHQLGLEETEGDRAGRLQIVYSRERVLDSMIRRLWIDGALLLLLVIAVTVGITVATRRALILPLEELHEAIRKGRDAELGLVSWASADELGRVIHEYNEVIGDELEKKATLKRRLSIYEEAFEGLQQGVSIFDRDFRLAAYNRRYLELLGHRNDKVSEGMSLSRLLRQSADQGDYGSASVDAVIIDHMAIAASGEPYRRERTRSDGTVLEIDSNPLPSGGFVTHYNDITPHRMREAQLRHMTLLDPLTRLPNRGLFLDRLRQALALAQRESSHLAVMIIDIDHLKDINNTYGEEVGDHVLCEVAGRLQQIVRQSDTIARLDGDELGVIQQYVGHVDETALLAHRLLGALTRPFAVGEDSFRLSASIGITLFPDDDDAPQNVLKNAELALHSAKAEGRRRYRFFGPEIDREVAERRQLEEELFRALRESQFVLFYQPRIDLGTGALMAAEVEPRWNHPERGWLEAAEFLPTAEERGLLVPLVEWMLEEACRQRLHWQRRQAGPWRVVTQLATRCFTEWQVAEGVAAVLKKSALPSQLLEIEIDEEALVHQPDAVGEALATLVEAGVAVTVRGPIPRSTSIGWLEHLSIDLLKISPEHVAGLTERLECETVAKTSIDLARRLRLRVVAAGINDDDQLRWLKAEGCDEVSGDLIAEPMVGEELTAWLATRAGGHLTARRGTVRKSEDAELGSP